MFRGFDNLVDYDVELFGGDNDGDDKSVDYDEFDSVEDGCEKSVDSDELLVIERCYGVKPIPMSDVFVKRNKSNSGKSQVKAVGIRKA